MHAAMHVAMSTSPPADMHARVYTCVGLLSCMCALLMVIFMNGYTCTNSGCATIVFIHLTISGGCGGGGGVHQGLNLHGVVASKPKHSGLNLVWHFAQCALILNTNWKSIPCHNDTFSS